MNMSAEKLSNWIVTISTLGGLIVATIALKYQHDEIVRNHSLLVNHENRTEAMESEVWKGFKK